MTARSVSRVVIGIVVAGSWATATPLPDAVSGVQPAPNVDAVLRAAPADALFVAYSTAAFEALTHPLAGELGPTATALRDLLKGQREMFSGPCMLAVSGMPANPMGWRVTFAAAVAASEDDLYAMLEQQIVPTWNRLDVLPGQMQFWRDGAIGHLIVVGAVPLSFNLALRDGLLLATTAPGAVEAWLNTGDTGPALVNGDDFARLARGVEGPIQDVIYVDLRPLVPLLRPALEQGLPKLYEALQLEKLEFAGVVGMQRMSNEAPAKEAAGERPARSENSHKDATFDVQRIGIGFASLEPGLWHAAASTPAEPTLAQVFPPNTTLLIHGSMQSLSAVADDVAAFAGAIAEDIVKEYEQEITDFHQEVGFDFQKEFLANFVGEWAIGADVDDDAKPLVALRLENPTTFRTQMQRLRAAFQLEMSPAVHRGVTIERAARKYGPFAYAVVDQFLLISPDESLLRGGIDAYLDKAALAHTEGYRRAAGELGPATSKLVYFNVAAALRKAIEADEANTFPEPLAFLSRVSTVALSVQLQERMISAELIATGECSPRALAVVAGIMMPSIARGRELSRREVSMANMKGILVSCHIYASENKGRWPHSLQELVAEGAITPQQIGNPYSPDEPATDKPYYLYRPVADPKAVRDPHAEVVLSEPELRDGEAAFGFLDGHVERIGGPRAEELLRIMRRGG